MEQIDSGNNKKRNILKLQADSLQSKLRSKVDFYKFLDEKCQFYLPPFGQLSKDFLKGVLEEDKELLFKEEVRYISISQYEEMSVKRLWTDLQKDDQFSKYFSDEYPDQKYPARAYFFNILNTLYPEYLKKIYEHAQHQRWTVDGEKQQEQAIYATEKWSKLLEEMPFQSSKNGRFLHLLKKSSKLIKNKRIRRQIAIFGTFNQYKQNKIDSKVAQDSNQNQPNDLMNLSQLQPQVHNQSQSNLFNQQQPKASEIVTDDDV